MTVIACQCRLLTRPGAESLLQGTSIGYVLSVARRYLTGKLITEHAVYVLREQPVAVASKGKTCVIDPDFKG